MQAWVTLAACVALGIFWIDHTRRERVAEIAFRGVDSENARLKDVLALLNAPETVVRVSSEGAAKPPQGKVFVHPDRGVLLLASNLPPAPAGKIYEMWVIPASGNPVPAGLFQTESNGTAVHLRTGPVSDAATVTPPKGHRQSDKPASEQEDCAWLRVRSNRGRLGRIRRATVQQSIGVAVLMEGD